MNIFNYPKLRLLLYEIISLASVTLVVASLLLPEKKIPVYVCTIVRICCKKQQQKGISNLSLKS